MVTAFNKTFFAQIKAKNTEAVTKIPFVKCGSGDKNILITAGMDGDEYNGIVAAQNLVNWFKQNTISGYSIYIFPIVNPQGFKTGFSQNPEDGKYPKHIYPGNLNGTASEKMIARVFKTAPNVELWLDLHSGASHETLTPFVWGFKTNVAKINSITKRILKAIKNEITLYTMWNKADKIANDGCCYLIFEAGGAGVIEKSAVLKLETWVKQAVVAFVDKAAWDNESDLPLSAYTKLATLKAPYKGYWRTTKQMPNSKNKFEGELTTVDYAKSRKITATDQGLILWHRLNSYVAKGDELCVQAYELKPTI